MKTIILLIILNLVFSCTKKNPSTQLSISFSIGEVYIKNKNSSTKAQKGSVVNPLDTIQTGPKSVAILSLGSDMGSVEIQENSEFSVEKFTETEQLLVSKSGNFWIDVKKKNKNSNFQVAMPTSVAGIRGTKFYSFEFKEEGIHGICHCQGAVEFKDNTSNYEANHDTDYAVVTQNGKTVLVQAEEMKKSGIPVELLNHSHSALEESPLGRKAKFTPEQIEIYKKLFLRKLNEVSPK